MDVGVRELKAELSAWLERAAAGELITVTSRGEPIATLGPLVGTVDLDRAVEQGWVRPPRRGGLGPATRHVATRSIADVLDEDRGE